MTGVHNNPNVGGVNNAGTVGGTGNAGAANAPTAADFGFPTQLNAGGNDTPTVIPAGNNPTTQGPKLSPEARAAMLRNITQNLGTPAQIAEAGEKADNGIDSESTANRAVAFASTLADFTGV